jgi:TrmH family RNA methyltransferase
MFMEGQNVFEMKTHEGILVIGSEGKGVRPEVAAKALHKLTIPRIGHAESLNAAVAAGIMISSLTSHPQKSRGH